MDNNTTHTNFIYFWNCVDYICGNCPYLSEEQCDKCPVRWMCDKVSNELNPKN